MKVKLRVCGWVGNREREREREREKELENLHSFKVSLIFSIHPYVTHSYIRIYIQHTPSSIHSILYYIIKYNNNNSKYSKQFFISFERERK